MAHSKATIVALVLVCNLALALAGDTSSSCYRIEPWTIAAITFADMLLTLAIVAVTYRYARFRHQKIENAHKVYENVRNNCKN